MAATFFLIGLVVLLIVGFVFSRWVAGLKAPSKGRKLQPKKHKHS